MEDWLWVAVGKVAKFLEFNILDELSTFHSVVIAEHYSWLFVSFNWKLASEDLHQQRMVSRDHLVRFYKLTNLTAGMQNGGVIATAESFADFW